MDYLISGKGIHMLHSCHPYHRFLVDPVSICARTSLTRASARCVFHRSFSRNRVSVLHLALYLMLHLFVTLAPPYCLTIGAMSQASSDDLTPAPLSPSMGSESGNMQSLQACTKLIAELRRKGISYPAGRHSSSGYSSCQQPLQGPAPIRHPCSPSLGTSSSCTPWSPLCLQHLQIRRPESQLLRPAHPTPSLTLP